MSLDFVTLDVFTKTPYQGNPLGVVHLPHDRPITQAQKQAIAREFNLSETVFLHDVDPANDPDPTTRRIDIFMTKGELPFAGHPTIGAAAYLRSRGVTTLGWHETFIGRYYHVITGTSVGADGTRTVRLRTRMVEDEMEDPATGSAACALTSYLALHEYEEREVRFEVTQGVEMGRRSDIGVVVKVAGGAGGQRMVDGVQLGGSAVEIMRGAVLEATTSQFGHRG
ncbi:Putative DNA helicase INO80 [Verticillium dahliae VDG1]|nr:Putative DNA helicase INO80 [Verticillium dahliae VDG1]